MLVSTMNLSLPPSRTEGGSRWACLLLLVLHPEDLVDVVMHPVDFVSPLIDDLGRDDSIGYLLIGTLEDLLEHLPILLSDEGDRFACDQAQRLVSLRSSDRKVRTRVAPACRSAHTVDV